MSESIVVRSLDQPGDLGWVVMAHGELYARELNWGQAFEALVARVIADFAGKHDPAREAGWIAELDGTRVGCVLCAAHDDAVAQLRILLVDPRARGQRLGVVLTERCVAFARDAGYQRVRLWTTSAQVEARAIYLKAGFALTSSTPDDTFGSPVQAETYELVL